jgi:hypothetical protein
MGEAYLVGGDLYVWIANENRWENVGNIQGPQGVQGQQGEPGPAGPVEPFIYAQMGISLTLYEYSHTIGLKFHGLLSVEA